MTTTNERPIRLTEAAKLLPGRHGHASVRTVIRYSTDGVRIAGRLVRLRTWRVGGMRVTSAEAVEEFVCECNGATPTRPVAGRDRRAEAGRAMATLDQAGI